MTVTKRMRFEVMQRDNFTCRYCRSDDQPLTIDHVIPVALGGADEPSNLVACCRDCNSGKSSTSPDVAIVEQVSEDAVRWSAAMRRAAVIQREQQGSRVEYVEAFDATWTDWVFGPDGEYGPAPRSDSWRRTVENWHDSGVDLESLRDLINDVMAGRVPAGRIWRYYCGAVRNMLEKRQEIAQGLIMDGTL